MRKFKSKKQKKRGTRTVGYGRVGQHRKTGQRVGRGKATQLKKSMKSYYLKQKKLGFPDPEWRLGKKGFRRPQDINRIYRVNALNLRDLDIKLDKFTEQNKATKSGTTYTINLDNVNIQKILGRGEINKKVNVSVKRASERAIEKIEAAGGKVTLLTESE